MVAVTLLLLQKVKIHYTPSCLINDGTETQCESSGSGERKLPCSLFSGNYVLENIQVTAAWCTILFIFPPQLGIRLGLKTRCKLFACFLLAEDVDVFSHQSYSEKKSNMNRWISQMRKGHLSGVWATAWSPVQRINFSQRRKQRSPSGKGKKTIDIGTINISLPLHQVLKFC